MHPSVNIPSVKKNQQPSRQRPSLQQYLDKRQLVVPDNQPDRRIHKKRRSRANRRFSWLTVLSALSRTPSPFVCLMAALLVVLGIFYVTQPNYRLSAAEGLLLNRPDKAVIRTISFNPKNANFTINAKGINGGASDSGEPHVMVGQPFSGIYSASLPTRLDKGITVYDNTDSLNFSLAPLFQTAAGHEVGNRFVYPLTSVTDVQAIYTPESDQLTEDLVINKPIGNQAEFDYRLNLPKYLAARKMPDGSIGIFSANPVLFGQISYGSDAADEQKIAQAKINGPKDYLMFELAAPVVRQSSGNQGGVLANAVSGLTLKGNDLEISAKGLANLHYPITIDPSILVNTTASFLTGNNEGDTTLGTNQFSESGLVGGAAAAPSACAGTVTGDWCASTSTATGNLPAATEQSTTVVYNGFIYLIGGYTTSASAAVDYSALASNGELSAPSPCAGTVTGDWCASTSAASGNLPTATYYSTALAFDGYVYLIGGYTGSLTGVVNFSAFASNGELAAPSACAGTVTGDWCASTSTATGSLPAATEYATAFVYNDYAYLVGGNSGSVTAVVNYTSLASNGELAAPSACAGTITGDWCASTSTATGSLPAATEYSSSVVYNGYAYVIGGYTSAATAIVNYTALSSNGELAAPSACAGTVTGDWCASTSTATGSLPAATEYSNAVVTNGYLYLVGGYTTSATAVTDYAQIYSGGVLGLWTASTSTTNGSQPAATYYASSAVYKGFIYRIGGTTGTVTAVVAYASMQPAGYLSTPVASTSTSNGSLPAATYYATATVYNSYIYQIGGNVGGSKSAVVYYSKLSTNGTLAAPSSCAGSPSGVWCASSSTANGSIGTATWQAASAASNGFLYLIGGSQSSTTAVVDYTQLNASNGAMTAPSSCAGTPTGDWCASTSTTNGSLPVATNLQTAVAYNGYVYDIGGCSSACPSAVITYTEPSSTGGPAAPSVCAGTITGDWCASTSTSNGSMPSGNEYSTSVVYNGYIYEIGGYTGSVTAVVDYTALASNGELSAPSSCPGTLTGDWCASTSTANGTLPAATDYGNAGVFNNYIYFLGGTVGGSSVSTVDYTVINSNGSLSQWQATSSLPGNTDLDCVVSYNGYVYLMGGYAPGVSAVVDTFQVNNGGPGTVQSWSSTIATTTGLENPASVTYDGYIYEIGGYHSSSSYSSVSYDAINTNGTLAGSSWNSATSLPVALEAPTAVVYNGYLYVLGGLTAPSTYQSTVYFAQLSSSGGLVSTLSSCPGGGTLYSSTWCSTTSLSYLAAYAGTITYNGYIYELGGANSGGNLTNVYSDSINSNGSLGSTWTSTTALPVASAGMPIVASGGYVYLVGANGTSTYYDSIGTSGTLGASWTATASFPQSLAYSSGVVYNGDIYILGGITSSTVQSVVYYAALNSGGGLSPWTATTILSSPLEFAAAVADNGFLYELGGSTNGTSGGDSTTVYYTGLNTLPRVGIYSILVNVGGGYNVNPDAIVLNGSNTGNPGIGGLAGLGGISLTYQNGTTGCPALSPATMVNLGQPELGAAYNLIFNQDGCSNTTALGEFAWLRFSVDDSLDVSYPDSSANHTSVTGFQIYYHPPETTRLRGGMTLQNGVAQPLDGPPLTSQ